MKVNLLLDDPSVRNGYLNIDQFASGKDERVFGDIASINAHVEAGEAEEVVALGILDYLPRPIQPQALNNWVSKLSRGGKIVLSGADPKSLGRALSESRISLVDYSVLVHGKQEQSWQVKKNLLTLGMMTEELERRGLKVIQKQLQDFHWLIVAERP